ncbi:MAG: hypothetical protein CMF98_00585 [Candidatus Marinimicrobia bacterium]|nr:hypothetical protein [Candidatus Neomarinimicrobiota bacterium]
MNNYNFLLILKLSFKTIFLNNYVQNFSLKRLVVLFLFIPTFLLIQLSNRIFLFLDNFFFRGYKKVAIKKPLFIVGIPRSGTTYIHNVISKNSSIFTTFSLWELIFAPSICQKQIFHFFIKVDTLFGKPLTKVLNLIEKKAFKDINSMHKTTLSSPEEDFFLFTSIGACFLLIIPFPFKEIWDLGFFNSKINPTSKIKILTFYKSMIKRHLYFYGQEKTYLSKNASFSPWVKDLLNFFPNSNYISCFRKPEETIPSQLSILAEGWKIFNNKFENEFFKDPIINIFENYYKELIKLSKLKNQNQFIVLKIQDIKLDFKLKITNIFNTFNYEIPPEFETILDEEDQKNKNYKSSHNYKLDNFNININDLKNRFQFVYKYFNNF